MAAASDRRLSGGDEPLRIRLHAPGKDSASASSSDDWPSAAGFRDQHGRRLWLRGVCLCAKSPAASVSAASDGHASDREISFCDEPIPLEDAREHFRRLRVWGLTLVRLGVPWEAVEHRGPGDYDQAYIAYVVELCRIAGECGLRVIIDPHQDVWSRHCGGSGAPAWTFRVAGLDVRRLRECGAAHLHQWPAESDTDDVDDGSVDGDAADSVESQLMLWPTNYSKLAAQTMFTLFFGGSTFAPRLLHNGEPVQEFLQRHYIACYRHLASYV